MLKKAKLRGLESDGMILSERELELSQEHEGIMLLPGDLAAGTPLSDVFPVTDQVLELEITSNRPDCLAVYGVAREVSAVLDTDLAPPPGADPQATGEGTVDDYVTGRIEAPDLCPRWAGRVFTDVTVGPSPPWLKARIAAAGMRSISNVVDITNYVMLTLGEPTHAFDLDKVAGREIIVRRAADGESVTTLDGQQRTLDTETLVIADAEKPSAIAGLMGAEWSEVTDSTTTVLLECANFDGPATQASSTRLGLRTEGSSRWEKGLDPYLPDQALALASELMVALCGARLVPGTLDLHGELPEPPLVGLRRERLEHLIGMEYSEATVERVLTRLGYVSRGRTLAGADVARGRHHPRGRPDRGGRPDRRRLEGADGDATARRRDRPGVAGRAPASSRDRRPARLRVVGVGDAGVHRRGARRSPAAGRGRCPARAAARGQPDGRRPGAAPVAAVPRPARLRAAQPRRRPDAHRAVRDRPRLPAGRR